jgi:uncharacterized metal-binding protein YceD (DUF177 family)
MQIRLDLIEDEPFRWSETEVVTAESMARPELLKLTEIQWSGSVAKAHPGYRLLAKLRYGQTMACDRCLVRCEEAVESAIDLILLVRPPAPAGGEVQLQTSELGVLELDGELLDTDPILREQLELNIPMTILCRPDCAGLCPHCGADRNLEPDCCSGPETDPRWQALKDLKLG